MPELPYRVERARRQDGETLYRIDGPAVSDQPWKPGEDYRAKLDELAALLNRVWWEATERRDEMWVEHAQASASGGLEHVT